MIVHITGFANKVLLMGSSTTFVIAIAQVIQTSYWAATKTCAKNLVPIVVLILVNICFVSSKKSMVNSIHVQSSCIH